MYVHSELRKKQASLTQKLSVKGDLCIQGVRICMHTSWLSIDHRMSNSQENKKTGLPQLIDQRLIDRRLIDRQLID
jgi:hypothetical protein